MSIRLLKAVPLLLLLLAHPAAAQESDAVEAADTAETPVWETHLMGRLSGSQVGYHNWTEGGVNTLAATSALEGKATGTTPNWQQTHEMRLVFGIVKQDTLALRKAEDVIRLRSTLQYRGNGFFKTLNPTVAVEANSQFAAGYNFKKNPFEDGREPPVKVSDALAPAAFTQSIGLTYNPRPWFNQHVGIASKQTVVTIKRFRPLYNLAPREMVRVELGVESRTRFEKEVFENVRYKSSLGLFAAFNKANVPDLLWENLVAMKVNSWLGVNLEFTTLYDRDLSDAIQVKESLSIGLSFKFV